MDEHLVDRYPQSIKNQIASYLEHRASILLNELINDKRPMITETHKQQFTEKAGAHAYLMNLARELKVK